MGDQAITKSKEGSFSRESFHTTKPQLPIRNPMRPILQLRQSMGNHSFGRFIQAKLKIGQPDDKYEKEADQVADRVMRMPAPMIQRKEEEEEEETAQPKPFASEHTPSIQRQPEPTEEEEEEETAQPKPLAGQITPFVQRQSEPTEEEEEEESAQAKLFTSEHSPSIQRQPTPKEEEEEEAIQPKALTSLNMPSVKRQALPYEKTVQKKPASAGTAIYIQRKCNSSGEECGSSKKEEEETAQPKPVSGQVTPLLQRQPKSKEEEEEEPAQPKPLPSQITPFLQRQPEPKEEEEEEESAQAKGLTQRQSDPVQTKFRASQIHPVMRRQAESEEKKYRLQAKTPRNSKLRVGSKTVSHIQSLQSGGEPLSGSDRSFFESRFGYDFGHIKIHTGARATESARAVRAHAYTVGKDVVFGEGQYRPMTESGRHLLAHELTHVIQQTGAKGAYRRQEQGQIARRVKRSSERR